MAHDARRLRLGVLFSGGARTLLNIVDRSREGTLPAEVVVAISSSASATGVERSRTAGIPCEVVDFAERKATFSGDLTRILDQAEVDLVCLAGFLKLYELPPHYEGRTMNIHPSLLPSFGGKGFYGDRVHEAVLRSGAKFSGCTVHFVTAEYDRGPIILQRVVPVHQDDTPHDLAARVFREECLAYPEAIRLQAEGRLAIEGGRVRILAGRGG